MAISKFGVKDWLLGWLVPQGTAGAYTQAVTLTSSAGVEYTAANPLPTGASAPFAISGDASLAVTASSARVALSGSGPQVMVTSPSANAIAFIVFGGAGVTAAVTNTPILPGTVQVFTPPVGTTNVAAIGTSGTTLYFTTGTGV